MTFEEAQELAAKLKERALAAQGNDSSSDPASDDQEGE